MYFLWAIVGVILLVLAIEDLRHYKVSMVLLLAWVFISAFIGYPYATDVWYNMLLLTFLFSALKLIDTRLAMGNLAIGDWIFLFGLAFHVSLVNFLWLTVLSHIIGLLFILINTALFKLKLLKTLKNKAPLVTMYSVVFVAHKILLWTK